MQLICVVLAVVLGLAAAQERGPCHLRLVDDQDEVQAKLDSGREACPDPKDGTSDCVREVLRAMLVERWNMWARYYKCMDKERLVFPDPHNVDA